MLDEYMFRLLGRIEGAGVGLSILAWLSVAAGVGLMARCLRGAAARVGPAPGVVGLVALAANLADYAITLRISPDLALEANPLWRNVVESFGLELAKVYGLTGKLLVSVLAGQMFAFYLANVERLFPLRPATSVGDFARRLGERSRTLGERGVALFTLFAFLFAGIQVLYFYVALLNAVADPTFLPSVPAAIAILLVVLGAAFVGLTYRTYRRGADYGVDLGATDGVDGASIIIDLARCSCGRTALGRLPSSADFYAERLHAADVFQDEALGLELGARDGRLDSICVDVTRYPGRLLLEGREAGIGPTTTEDELRERLGEPWWRDEDPDETLLFYEDGRVERQFEFAAGKRTLTCVMLLSQPLMADPEQRAAYGVTKPWPPSHGSQRSSMVEAHRPWMPDGVGASEDPRRR